MPIQPPGQRNPTDPEPAGQCCPQSPQHQPRGTESSSAILVLASCLARKAAQASANWEQNPRSKAIRRLGAVPLAKAAATAAQTRAAVLPQAVVHMVQQVCPSCLESEFPSQC
mmetsp:Transcript_15783/g.34555  ORF Transcript_15783/g.34555 Transcript_15783/m.34555 type:complete len:113 (+) Transcript_15783:525-863(+)